MRLEPGTPTEPVSSPAEACLNCGVTGVQRFCPACGQASGHRLQRPFREILGEVLEETIALDSRFAHTFRPLLLRPGFLTVEHLAGRRARYTSPLKLYLLFSFVFFVAAALTPGASLHFSTPQEAGATEEVTREADAGVAELRARGRIGVRVAERVTALRAMPQEEARARAADVLQENAPRVLFFLVPVLALLLKVAFRRRYFAEHLVGSFHAHAVGFAALLPGELANSSLLTLAGTLATGLWVLLALHRIHGEGWGRTLAKGFAVLLAYLSMLAIGLVAVLSAGLLLL
jgi:hypothetical protein